MSFNTTDKFYSEIAKNYIEEVKSEIEFTYFNLNDYKNRVEKEGDNSLVELYKILSPIHLLKLPFLNDSNTLDRGFYRELLHIMGLEEVTTDGGKNLIQRKREGDRHSGTLLEDTIQQLEALDKVDRVNNPSRYGATKEERLFNIALELNITWINRVLFLKLLESQLISYHSGDRAYSFLNSERLPDYDNLNKLFFQVLAKNYEDRTDEIKEFYSKIPYLNSSLFEPTELEYITLFISNLSNDKAILIFALSVLKDRNGKRVTGDKNSLQYLFEFLDSYNFSSDGTGEIQEESKTLINASVLGLIFEKINGYQDGSFFTPGMITMYMCKEALRKAVVQKFNEVKGWDVKYEELYNKINDKEEANKIVNSLKICDPSVGSGHFLVSVLNEIIAIKHTTLGY